MTLWFLTLLLLQPPDAKVYPAPGKYCGVVRVAAVSKWSVLGISGGDFVPVKIEVMDGGKSCLVEGDAGSYAITQWPEGAASPVNHFMKLGTVKPPEPVPPGPTPTPVPPGPIPPAPIPVAGLKVLIVYESGTVSTLPRGQQITLGSTTLRRFLEERGAEYRIYDKDVNAESDKAYWRDALKRPRSAIPWLIVSNGKSGFEGPLPATVDEVMSLIEKYKDQ